MISFYPGPSRVHDEIPLYVQDAFEAGLLSINHRSDEFMAMSERTIALLKDRLDIPPDYTVFYTTSATECWEIIAQSLVVRESYHFFSGAFGKKWFEYTRRLRPGAQPYPFDRNQAIDPQVLQTGKEQGVICVTQNETSNGTQVSDAVLAALRKRFPDDLIAVDATSGMAGVRLNFAHADIWFASVQKCFGLPAGLGLMICSPAAMARVKQIDERDHYNSLAFMADMMEKWQTPFTPNVLNIYLLGRVLEASDPIDMVHDRIVGQYRLWASFLGNKKSLRHLITNEEVRSYTVIPVSASESLVTEVKAQARRSGFLLGEGYGDLKASTFRIANFPALLKSDILALMAFLGRYE